MNKTVIAFISALAIFSGCSLLDDGEHPAIDELGAVQTEYTLGYAEGTFTIKILADKEGRAEVPDTVDWMAIPEPNFDGDAEITVNYMANDGEAREAKILLKTKTREEFVTVNQSAKP